jgi:type IV pilus assembly protein PilM
MSEEELSKQITHNTQHYIPFDIDDVVLDFEILGIIRADEEEGFKNSEQIKFLCDSQDNYEQAENSEDSNKMRDFMEVLLVAVKKNIINEKRNILQEAGLKPVIIDLEVFALMNAARLTKDFSSMGNVALVDLGDSFTHISIIQDGAMSHTRDIPIGGGYLTNTLMSKLKVPFEQILGIKRGKFSSDIKEEEVIETILQAHKKVLEEIKKYFEYFITLSNHQIERVFLCGGGSMIRGLDGFFSDYLKVPVETLDPMQEIKVNPKHFNQSLVDEMSSLYGVALGLATRRFDYI